MKSTRFVLHGRLAARQAVFNDLASNNTIEYNEFPSTTQQYSEEAWRKSSISVITFSPDVPSISYYCCEESTNCQYRYFLTTLTPYYQREDDKKNTMNVKFRNKCRRSLFLFELTKQSDIINFHQLHNNKAKKSSFLVITFSSDVPSILYYCCK